MNENEIAIIVSLQDKMTEGFNKIQDTLEKGNKVIRKQTEQTSKTFDKQMGSLLVLGNAANSVDNIFSSYQNMQLRLENASERVANAQDRLSDAQYNLNKLSKSGTASASELAKAQQDVERASRGMTIAQNNQARANNMVIGTYITMGIQVINLTKSMPILIAQMKGLVATANLLALTPFGIILAVASGAVLAGTAIWREHKEEIEKTKEEYDKFMEMVGKFAPDPRGKEEAQLQLDVVKKRLEVAQMEQGTLDKGIGRVVGESIIYDKVELAKGELNTLEKKLEISQLQNQVNMKSNEIDKISKNLIETVDLVAAETAKSVQNLNDKLAEIPPEIPVMVRIIPIYDAGGGQITTNKYTSIFNQMRGYSGKK